MKRNTFLSSPKATVSKLIVSKYGDFPWQEMELGTSFNVKVGEISLNALRVMASQKGKVLGRKFKVVFHSNEIGYEVAYVEERKKKVEEKEIKKYW